MDFSPSQQNGKFTNPNQNYTDPLRVHADHSGGIALARESGRSGLNLWGAALQYKETVDSAKSMEANNEYNRLMSEGTALLMQKKQEQAVNIVDEYDKLHTKVLEQVQKRYKNYIGYGKAAVEFNNYTTRDNATRRSNMLKYQLAETDAFHETQFNNSIATCDNMVLDGGGTDEAIDAATARMESLVNDRYVNYGDAKKEEQKRLLKGQLISDALAVAIKLDDYPRMGEIALKYSNFLDPKTRISVLSMLGKRQKEAHELRQANDLWARYGENGTKEDYRNYFRNESNANMRFDHYDSLLGDEMPNGRNGCVEGFMRLTAPFFSFSAENKEEVNVGNVCRLAQNSDNVRLERYNGGEIPEGSGIIYFSEGDDISDFDNAEHITMADGNGGFYGNSSSAKDYEDEEGNTVRGNGCIVHSDNQEIGGYKIGYIIRMDEQTMNEMSDLEIEEKVDKAWSRRNKRISEINAMENQWIEKYSLKQQDLLNQGVEDPDAYDALALEAWQASGYSERVRTILEKQGGQLRKIQSKAAEREAARESGTGGSGGSSGGKKNSDALFLTRLEVLLRNGTSRQQAYDLIEEVKPSNAVSAVNLVNDYFAGKEKYAVKWQQYEGAVADYCGVKKNDGDFGVLYGEATNYAYELIMQYRDEHGGKDPTSQQILEYLIDGVTKTRIDTGERSWFGFGSPEYKESPLTPAEWFNRGVYNDPAEDYDADRGVYVVKTRRGTFAATEEQYQRIVDGEDADVVLSR